ncbi:MAG TPA: helix-turn-helix domain-containing protein [Candidatus Saccharimonadales bacterium]|nr:helix-turn-helix domain-containing protein [Candidatus Saccharimonadales bacterium]
MICKAAHDIIMQHGPRSLTFQSLGEATGLVPAALVRRFGTKRQLLIEVDTYWLEAAADTLAVAAMRHDSSLEAIVEALSSEMSFANSSTVYTNSLSFLLESLNNPKLYKNYQSAFKRQQESVENLLEIAKEKNELGPDVNCNELSKLLQVTQQGACHMWIMSQAEAIEVCIERYLRLALQPYVVDKASANITPKR